MRVYKPTLFVWAIIVSVACAAPEDSVYETAKAVAPESPIDKIVFREFSRKGLRPLTCTDAVFLRRAYIDVIGTLPTAQEAREFLKDPSLNKRRALIDRLLARDEFADYWAMKWSDLLRVKAEFPVNLWPNAAQAYHRWIRASLRDNKPYDRFVRELLTSNGSNFRVGPVNFYRAVQSKTPEGIASAVALAFMGSRTDHWSTNGVAGLAVFFSQLSYKPTREWKEEIVFWNPEQELPAPAAPGTNAVAAAPVPARAGPLVGLLPDKTKIKLPPDRDPREIFADWLITPNNPWFTLAISNRVWFWLLGRGIIHEPDDIRANNPPSHPALLAYLQKELVKSGYDTKHLFRLILNSRTYQLSSVAPASQVKAGEALFAYYPLRRLDAEVLIDAINKVTGTTDLYTSAIPEPFTFIPANKPAIALPDGSITSSFLELFGRPARATGMENERVNKPLPPQRMHLLNSSHIQRKLEDGPVMKMLLGGNRKQAEIIEELYLTILSRYPTPSEAARVDAYIKSGVVKGREAGLDLAWALINSAEFLYRH
jgi:hypothetical protein